MDLLLAIVGGICLLVGLAGAILPLPGPPLSYVGLLLFHFTKFGQFSQELLFSLGFATLLITVLDYYIPVWGTKKFGGTKAGTRSSTAGMIIGMFFGPFGIFIGAFAGAFIGETLWGDKQNALKAAMGSFVGFAAGIMLKVALCCLMIFYVVKNFF